MIKKRRVMNSMTEKKKEKAGVSMEVLGVSTLNIDLKN